jgi:hypothetical protein
MHTDLQEWHKNLWRTIAFQLYQTGLALYPHLFRERFGSEMKGIFLDALDDQAQQGPWAVFRFFLRELLDAPAGIFNQHLEAKTFWLRPYPINIGAFSVAFVLLGMIENTTFFQHLAGWAGYIITLLLIGGLSGLAIGSTLDPNRKKLFFLSGAIGFLIANTQVKSLFLRMFPEALSSPGVGWQFLIPFQYPIMIGSVFGLFIGMASGNWRGLFQWTGLGAFGMCAGFFINRLSAALMQSFLFHSPTQDIFQTGLWGVLSFLVIPYLLQGILLGTLFGGASQRGRSVKP